MEWVLHCFGDSCPQLGVTTSSGWLCVCWCSITHFPPLKQPCPVVYRSRPSQDTPLSIAESREQKIKKTSKPCVSSEPDEVPWLFPNLRVRMIDQKFHNGIYYNQKVCAHTHVYTVMVFVIIYLATAPIDGSHAF